MAFALTHALCSDGPVGGLDGGDVPRFSATELAPTHHDGATGAVLGCPHYARACKSLLSHFPQATIILVVFLTRREHTVAYLNR